jgi:hypothetical protein
LVAIDPAGEDQEQQVPWLKLRFHVPPDARFRSGASGIVGCVSSVSPGVTSVRGKTRRYSHLRLGGRACRPGRDGRCQQGVTQ